MVQESPVLEYDDLIGVKLGEVRIPLKIHFIERLFFGEHFTDLFPWISETVLVKNKLDLFSIKNNF